LHVIFKKCFNFQRPDGPALLESGTMQFQPGTHLRFAPSANPVLVEDWVTKTKLYELALKDGDIIEVYTPTAKSETEVTERHAAFLRSRGYKTQTVEAAQKFVARMSADDRAGFLADAAEWKPVEASDHSPQEPQKTPEEKPEEKPEEDDQSTPAPANGKKAAKKSGKATA
jgi:hypothetical protein